MKSKTSLVCTIILLTFDLCMKGVNELLEVYQNRENENLLSMQSSTLNNANYFKHGLFCDNHHFKMIPCN